MIFLQAAQGPIKLTARADRLEYDKDGQWTIVDYKTGTVPSGSLIKKGVRNQLAVEGLIAFDGGFESLPAGADKIIGILAVKRQKIGTG